MENATGPGAQTERRGGAGSSPSGAASGPSGVRAGATPGRPSHCGCPFGRPRGQHERFIAGMAPAIGIRASTFRRPRQGPGIRDSDRVVSWPAAGRYNPDTLAPRTSPGRPMPTDDAVTVWLGQLQAGDAAFARPLWDKYFHRLVGLARTRLRDTPRRAADEEDVALSAFDSFCRNAARGRFPELTDRDGLWRILASFTLRKAAHHCRDATRRKRGGGSTDEGADGLGDLLGRDPTPELAAELAEECDRLLAALGDAELKRVALLRM